MRFVSVYPVSGGNLVIRGRWLSVTSPADTRDCLSPSLGRLLFHRFTPPQGTRPSPARAPMAITPGSELQVGKACNPAETAAHIAAAALRRPILTKASRGSPPPQPNWLETPDEITQSNAEIRATANAAMCIFTSTLTEYIAVG